MIALKQFVTGCAACFAATVIIFANVLVAAHKGVIRMIAERVLGESLPSGEPALGGVVSLSCSGDGRWYFGRRGSNPEGL